MKRKIKIDFISIILIILLIIALWSYAQLKIFGNEHINLCGYTLFQVITGSMENTIKIKDIVIVDITKEVNVNDIITYRSNGNFITHRVIQINNDEIITKGDANNTEDSPITRDDIVGKVIIIIPNVAVWMNVLKTPQVIFALVITLISIKVLFFKNEVKK